MVEYDLILNELSTIRARLEGIEGHLETQNSRIRKAEDSLLIIEHNSRQEHEDQLEANADKRQDKMLQEFGKLFEKYLRPVITMGGIGYIIAKLSGWVP